MRPCPIDLGRLVKNDAPRSPGVAAPSATLLGRRGATSMASDWLLFVEFRVARPERLDALHRVVTAIEEAKETDAFADVTASSSVAPSGAAYVVGAIGLFAALLTVFGQT